MPLPRLLHPMLLENPSFELGLQDWTVETDGVSGSLSAVTADTVEIYHRKQTAKLVADAASGSFAGLTQDAEYTDLVVGETFELRLFAKGAGALLLEVIELSGQSFIVGDKTSSTVNPTGSWGVFVLSHTLVDASATSLRVRVRQTSAGSTANIDFVVMGRPFAISKFFTTFDEDDRRDRKQNESGGGSMETVQLFKKDDVVFGWKRVFPALLADIKAFFEDVGGGAPFALFFDPSIGSSKAWPQLVMRTKKMPSHLEVGVERYDKIIFKTSEVLGR